MLQFALNFQLSGSAQVHSVKTASAVFTVLVFIAGLGPELEQRTS